VISALRKPATGKLTPRRQIDPNDLQVRDLFVDTPEPAHLALLGLPDDTAVAAGGGRPGAAGGPAAFREAVSILGSAYDVETQSDASHLKLVDMGDAATIRGDSRASHEAVTAAVDAALARARLVVAVGGGHDLTFAALRALARLGNFGGVNVDAHLDVRTAPAGVITSGTPFRRALEELPQFAGDRFSCVGAAPGSVGAGHARWLRAQGSQIHGLAEVRRRGSDEVVRDALRRAGAGIRFVSLDLDVVTAAHAPGVSAPAAVGLDPVEFVAAARTAAADPTVRYIDLMELNPEFDTDGRTARLAAIAFAAIVSGVADRAAAG
jgi:formimidoylglutamase